MVTRIPITKARVNLGAVVKRAHLKGEYFILEKDGIPVAGLLDADELEAYLQRRDTQLTAQLPSSSVAPAHKIDAVRSGPVTISKTETEQSDLQLTDGSRLILQRAFVQAVASTVGRDNATALFDLFNQLALLRYEDAESVGYLILRPPAWRSAVPIMRFSSPFDVNDVRGVRKMLQISEPRLCLLCNGQKVYGLTTETPDDGDGCLIQFRDHGIWEVRQRGTTVVRIQASNEDLPSTVLSEDLFRVELQTSFRDLTESKRAHLWALVSAARRQSRGTNILVSAQASSEAERLASQCTLISPMELTPALMDRITSIDGTVIIDEHGICYAIGAILDGNVSSRGDRTRGGRFNSALMYVDSTPIPSVIVVISQDGMVDIVSRSRRLYINEVLRTA